MMGVVSIGFDDYHRQAAVVHAVPESARFLLQCGQVRQAEELLRAVCAQNGRSAQFVLRDRRREKPAAAAQEAQTQQPTTATSDSAKLQVWTHTMVKHALILCLSWFTVTVLYYGLGYSAGAMAGDLYWNAALLAIADIPGNLLYAALADNPRWGRRYTQAALFIVAAGCLLLAPLCANVLHSPLSAQLTRYLSIGGKLCTAGTFNGVFVYAAEIFPTSTRTTGLGLCNVFARLGGVIAPLALQLGPELMAWSFGGLALVSGAATLLLPETRNIAL